MTNSNVAPTSSAGPVGTFPSTENTSSKLLCNHGLCTERDESGGQCKRTKLETQNSGGSNCLEHSKERSPSFGTYIDARLRPLHERMSKMQEELSSLKGQRAEMKETIAAMRKDRLAMEEQDRSTNRGQRVVLSTVRELYGAQRLRTLQCHMQKESLLYLGVPEESCAFGVYRWPSIWKLLLPTNHKAVEDHFGEHIYGFIQEDLSEGDTKRGAGDAEAVTMDDIRASMQERAFLLDVIDNWKSGKARKGAEAAYCWVFKEPKTKWEKKEKMHRKHKRHHIDEAGKEEGLH